METESKLLAAIERLTLNGGVNAEWHAEGLMLSAPGPIESEFFPPGERFHHGFLAFPGKEAQVPALTPPYFLLGFGPAAFGSEKKLRTIGKWRLWEKKVSPELLSTWELSRVENVPAQEIYRSLDPMDGLLGTVLDPFTQYYLAYSARDPQAPTGKCRMTDGGNGAFLLSRPFTVNSGEKHLLWQACENRIRLSGGSSLLILEDPADATPESFGFEKRALACLNGVDA